MAYVEDDSAATDSDALFAVGLARADRAAVRRDRPSPIG
jgi:hypothetical protein